MFFTRSDASSPPPSGPSSSSSKSQLPPQPHLPSPSHPHTPTRPSHFLSDHPQSTPASVGLLTPSSSRASLYPATPQHKASRVQSHPASPAFSLNNSGRKSKRASSHRRQLFPTRPTLLLELNTRPAQYASYMTASPCPVSPHRHSRALSPSRPEHIPRPPSRCENLLRDTLRRADELERNLYPRSTSRSPVRMATGRKTRPRGSSLLGSLSPDLADGELGCDDNVFAYSPNDTGCYLQRAPSIGRSAPRGVRGVPSSPHEAVYPYGSPSSPSPMPPSMQRTRTAPAVPRPSKRQAYDDDYRGAPSKRPSPSPHSQRRSLPNSAMNSAGPRSHAQSHTTSNESSPKQRAHALSPHESVLRAKLEYVLQRAGPLSTADELDAHHQFGGRLRNHHRAHSHNVIVVTSKGPHDDLPSPSPQSLAASSLSNSATDLARINSTPTYCRQDSLNRTSPSSPPEPITPPPTPPFNARTASEFCKRMDGYVSFASVEGLGEPPGMDIDSDDGEENMQRWSRWWRMWPFANGANGAEEHETGHLVLGRHRSGSTVSR
ncbi:hypothetical protein DFH11DRAFT_1539993 [Phellopilus nigrolimitatus]|nr:hypothetical protein DFH11DRAFT_1539993 [Phellopilus nigrolimitatus]